MGSRGCKGLAGRERREVLVKGLVGRKGVQVHGKFLCIHSIGSQVLRRTAFLDKSLACVDICYLANRSLGVNGWRSE